jgi:hypothetical protein
MGASCGQKALGLLPGVVNDPSNLTLRRAILEYGTNRLCSEMQKRSVPLRLNDGDPAIGRFYPTSCAAQNLANENLFIQFAGYGYAWTNLTKRMGFEAGGAVEYDHDFLMDGSTMYVYFRQRSTTAASFTTGLIEQPGTAVLGRLPIGQGPQAGQNYANALGAQIMKNEVARGFTVIRDADGTVSFSLGVVERGARPAAPYKIAPSGRQILANERTEVHQNQRDYAGPFEVKGDGALYLSVAIDGAPGIDVLVVGRGLGETWLQTYTHQAAPSAPPAPPALDEPVYSGALWRKAVPLPEGLYFVVFDNTGVAGRTQPTTYANDDRAALVNYAVEMGDAP